MKNQKILAVLFGFLVIISVFYFAFIRWTTYTDKYYGFEVSFPKSFSIAQNQYKQDILDGFDYSIGDEKNEYLRIKAYKKTTDYKGHPGPFPEEEITVVKGFRTNPAVFNGISGFLTTGAYEGATGKINYFEFVRNDMVWVVEFTVDEMLFTDDVDLKVYEKIKQSFRVF